MKIFTLLFLIGILIAVDVSTVPSYLFIGFISLFALGCAVFRDRHSFFRWLFALSSGFVYASLSLQWILAWTLPYDKENSTLDIQGRVASIPSYHAHSTSFIFEMYQFDHRPVMTRIRLTWNGQHKRLTIGDDWHFRARLKRIHGTANAGGVDQEALAFQSGIRASGFIMPHLTNRRISYRWFHHPVGRLRQYLRDQITEHLPITTTSPWIMALAIGERQGIAQDQWTILRNTGTNHLMAIAGLHIGCMAGLAHVSVSWCWRRMPFLALRFPSIHAGALAALGMACVYSLLSGFSLPAQRACMMLFAFLYAQILRRYQSVWQGWCLALLGVLLLNPLSVLSDSFWLSFGSVALIIYGMSARISPGGLWWKYGRIQWVVALGLIPLGIALFHQYSLTSFVANSISIPVVALWIVPLTLLGSFLLLFSGVAGGAVLHVADLSLGWVWHALTFLANQPGSSMDMLVSQPFVIVSALLAMLLLLLPQGAPGRWLGLVYLLPLLCYQPAQPKPQDVWFTLLDVGQGLSAVVQTHEHVLVFDTGAHLGEANDKGESVVVPFLHAMGVKQIDRLVISHGDNDHIGGAEAILSHFPVKQIHTSVPEKFSKASWCLRGQSWIWDGVEFTFLHPTPMMLNLDNNSSCVLKITAGHQSLLLTGDIEREAEHDMLSEDAKALKADVLVVPHHGSHTSDEDAFIDAVNPRIALFPVGYRNRYHLPHPDVVSKYRLRHIQVEDTVTSGAIQLRWGVNNPLHVTERFRTQHRHVWSDQSKGL